MNKIDDYEKIIEERQEINSIYLDKFEEWLVNKGLSDKTIRNHVSNAEFYINNFLTYYGDCPMEKGIFSIDSFFRRLVY